MREVADPVSRSLSLYCQKASFCLKMELSSPTEREEEVPFVSVSSRVLLEMGNRGGEMDLVANRCSSQSVRLWQAYSLHRAKQAHFLNRCPK